MQLEKTQNYDRHRKMDGIRNYKFNKPDLEKQILHVLCHVWNVDLCIYACKAWKLKGGCENKV